MNGEKFLIVKPKLMQRTKIIDEKTANQSIIISKKNTSRFFSFIYSALFGGKVKRDSIKDIKELKNGIKIATTPDILLVESDKIKATEVKASSTRSARYEHTFNQMQNYCCDLLLNFDKGKKPLYIHQALFQYGGRNLGNLHKLNKSQLVQALSHSSKSLTIIPFNLGLFLFHISSQTTKNQSSNNSSCDELNYKTIGTGLVNRLHKKSELINLLRENLEEVVINPYPVRDLVKDFFLNNLKYEKTKSPQIIVHYQGISHVIEPFPIIEYKLSKRDYVSWIEHFSNDHKKIIKNLELRNLYQEINEVFS